MTSRRRHPLKITAALLAIACVTPPALAEVPLGRRARVRTAAGATHTGLLVAIDDGTLRIETEGGMLTLAAADVRKLQVYTGSRRRTNEGLLAGALAWGAIVGLMAAVSTLDESGVGEPLFVAGVVTAGGLVGRRFEKECWREVKDFGLAVAPVARGRGLQAQLALRF